MWQALESFSGDERAAFLRFVWGRSRLPLTRQAFSQTFSVQGFGREPADNFLPVSHTCFFSLELPRYSSLEVMTNKLRYAIINCTAIDADNTSNATASASMWEE